MNGFVNQLRVAIIVLGLPATVVCFFIALGHMPDNFGEKADMQRLMGLLVGCFGMLASATLVGGALAGHRQPPPVVIPPQMPPQGQPLPPQGRPYAAQQPYGGQQYQQPPHPQQPQQPPRG